MVYYNHKGTLRENKQQSEVKKMEKVNEIINGIKINGIPTYALEKKYIAAIDADGLWFWEAYDSYTDALKAYDDGATDVIFNPSFKRD